MKTTAIQIPSFIISIICLLALSNCDKDSVLDTLDDSRSVEHRVKTIKQPYGQNSQHYFTSTFYYDSSGRCIQHESDSAMIYSGINHKWIWTWSNSQIIIDEYRNGATVPDTSWTIYLDNNGLMTHGNPFGLYDSALFNSQQQMIYEYTSWNPGEDYLSSLTHWSATGNKDSVVYYHSQGETINSRYTYVPGSINTINIGRPYRGKENQNLIASSSYDGNHPMNYNVSYEFDSLNRVTKQIRMASGGWADTIFYTYY